MNSYPHSLPAAAAYEQIKADNGFLLDVREPAELAITRAEGVDANIPSNEIERRISEIPKDRPIYTICASGHRSLTAANKLKSLGFKYVVSIDGGTKAWKTAGLPTVTRSNVLPLDQQFRLILGGIVLSFTLLGAFKSKKFLIGTGFIGIMLSITALLGICPMMDVIKILPWNRVPVD